MDLRPATRASRGSSRGAVDSSPVTAGAAVARLSALPAFARQTTGNITGRIIDAQAVNNKGIVVNVGESPLIETRSPATSSSRNSAWVKSASDLRSSS